MTRIVHNSSNCNSVSWLPYKKYINSDISSPPPPPHPHPDPAPLTPPPPPSLPSSASRTLPVSVHPFCVNLADALKTGESCSTFCRQRSPSFQRCYCSLELILSNNSSADRYGLFRVKGDLHVTGSVELFSLASLAPSCAPSSQTLSPFPPPVISLALLLT